jgi:hypothetical protein
MRLRYPILLFVTVVGLSSCGKSTPPAAGPVATVTLKDGSTFTGTVTKSDTSAITIQSPTGETRTYPMTQVSGVQYGSDQTGAPVPSTAANTPPPPPVTSAAPAGAQAPPPVAAAPSPAPVERRPAESFRTIPSGATLQVRTNQTINSDTASTGQTYSGVVAHDVLDTEGRVAIPHGADATLVVRGASGQGKLQGQSELALDVGSVTVGGREYRLETSDFVEKGRAGVGKNKRTAEFLGGGTALGGIIGAIAGGGKGAAIGALSGAAAGTATQAVTRGKAVHVPAETVLSFKLEAPIRIREMQ